MFSLTELRDSPPDNLHPSLVDTWVTFCNSKSARRLEETDVPQLYRLFQYRSMLEDLRDVTHSKDFDYVTTSASGVVKMHPAVTEMGKIEKVIVTLERELGLSPASRFRIRVGKKETGDVIPVDVNELEESKSPSLPAAVMDFSDFSA